MKEQMGLDVMKLMGDKMVSHDDKMLLRALKVRPTERGRKGGAGLADDWYRYFPIAIDDEGRSEQIGYYNKLTKESHGLDWQEKDRMQTEAGWVETFRRRLKLDEGVWVQAEGNQLDLTIANLWGDFGSRYRAALGYVLDLTERGIIKYKPIKEINSRSMREALRNRLKREFKPTEYEFDILFRGELGKMLHDAFREAARGSPGVMHAEEGTVYIAGYNRYPGLKRVTKYYDIGIREGERAGRLFKLEITLLKAYFKSKSILVSDMLEQPKIQTMLQEDLAKEIKQALDLVTSKGDIMSALQQELELDTKATVQDITSAMLNTKRTLTERVEALERTVAEHSRILAELREKRGR